MADDDQPPAYDIDDDYVAVRRDVLANLNAADINLPKCETALDEAQGELVRGQENIDKLSGVIDTLQSQKRVLEAHITALETVMQREPTYGDQFVRGWEKADGPLGLLVGWGVGTAQCIGLAWVFNQEGFRARE